MFQKVRESKFTWLAIGIIAGLALTFVYQKWAKKE